MALVLKTSDTERYRGFESLSLRHFHNLWAMQKYPSGRRGSPAKGVGCGKRRVGSNPTFCARRKSLSFKDFFFFRFYKRKNSFISDKFPFMFERVVFKNERQKLTQKLTQKFKILNSKGRPERAACCLRMSVRYVRVCFRESGCDAGKNRQDAVQQGRGHDHLPVNLGDHRGAADRGHGHLANRLNSSNLGSFTNSLNQLSFSSSADISRCCRMLAVFLFNNTMQLVLKEGLHAPAQR